MTEIDPQSPPKNSREIGIHLVYMSKAIDDIRKELANMSRSFATKQELLDAIQTRQREQEEILKDLCSVDNRVKKLESLFSNITAKIAGIAITFLVLMILAQYGFDKYFRG